MVPLPRFGAVDWIVVRVVVSDRTEGAGDENVEGDLRDVVAVVIVWLEGFCMEDGELFEPSEAVEGNWLWRW